MGVHYSSTPLPTMRRGMISTRRMEPDARSAGEDLEQRYDVAIVGAGLVGLATAYALLLEKPRLRIVLLDKEPELAAHQSGRNSGVIHSGLYYAPGSLKARLCREGRTELIRFADQHQIPYDICGKLVVALDDAELPRLGALEDRALANGLQGVRVLDGDEIREREPHANGRRALLVPEAGVIDFTRVAHALAAEVRNRGGQIVLAAHVVGVTRARRAHRCSSRTVGGRCAKCRHMRRRVRGGIAALTGDAMDDHAVVPFRGDYYTFEPHARRLVEALVYPVPDPAFPFLGVHFTRRIDGNVWAGRTPCSRSHARAIGAGI